MEKIILKRVVIVLLGVCVILLPGDKITPVAAACSQPGWFPTTFGLKDHSVFWYKGFYYLVSIYLPGETFFAYGRSIDLCNWQDLTPVLSTHTPGAWDEQNAWAPFVYEEAGTYYMYYTGTTRYMAQSIMLATSNDPADPNSWQRQGMVFQPQHSGMVWGGFYTWSDCRDPTVIKIGSTYYLYYTGRDSQGGIIGVATASSPLGPWHDWGAILSPMPGHVLESSTVAVYDGVYYLFYHDTPSNGERFRMGPGPTGPWTQDYSLLPGWADEVWQSQNGDWYASFLTDYTVTISRLTWDTFFKPARPVIGNNVYHLLLPLVTR